MKKLFFLNLIFCLLLAVGCKNKNQNDNSTQKTDHSNAIPDALSPEDGKLSEVEKNALANAQGRQAETITIADLEAMFSHSKDKIHIYSFWKNNDRNCTEVNKALLDIQKEVGDSLARLIFINLDDASQLPLVNSFIREYGVTSNVFVTSDSLNMGWYDQIHPTWSGEVPAVYLKNESDGVNLFYQKNFTAEELTVLLQPFIL